MNFVDKHPTPRGALIACAFAVFLALPVYADADLSTPETAVEAGRRGLDKSPAAPWYDAKTDDFRPAKIKPPRKPRTPWQGWAMGGWVQVLAWIALAAILAWVVYLIAKAYLLREDSEAEQYDTEARHGADLARVEELPIALAAAPGNYLSEARRLYAAGDVAQAIVYLFSHQLLALDRRHWVRLVKGKTNHQYLREVRRSAAPSASELGRMFEETVLLFEEVFFGKRLPPRENIEHCWRQTGAFETLVEQTVEKAA